MTGMEILEAIMLCCFGASWPFQVLRTWKTKTAKSKSFVFLSLLIIGYLAGMGSKLLADKFSYVFFLYVLNLLMVGTDFLLSIKYRKSDKLAEKLAADELAAKSKAA